MASVDNDHQEGARSRGKQWWRLAGPSPAKVDNLRAMQKKTDSDVTLNEFDSSSSSIQSGNTEIFSCGCMKVRTQEQSIQRQFGAEKRPDTKKVAFSTVDLHIHRLVLGDNPSISSGPPLTISWRSEFSATLSVDEYEKHHPDRRLKDALQVPRSLREDWLKDEGYSRREMKEAETGALLVKAQRTKAANQGEFLRAVAKTTDSIFRKQSKSPRCPVC